MYTINTDLASRLAPHLAVSQTPSINTSLLTKVAIMAEFPSVFDGIIRVLDGHIHLTTNAKPYCVISPRTIPYAYQKKLAKELESLQQQQIIAPVTEPTDCCVPIVVTLKKHTDSIHLCVDLSHLNCFVQPE